MATIHKVKAAAAVVVIGGADRYLYQGAVVPDGVDTKDLDRLVKAGLLEKVEVKTAAEAEADADAKAKQDADAAAAAKAKADADAKAKADADAKAKANTK
ncbi:hypothetical protein JTF08_13700 [Micrococcaceae bacterium RIT802]|nr:hypothetical protein [Micrococcaceae bacterium RIT 802]